MGFLRFLREPFSGIGLCGMAQFISDKLHAKGLPSVVCHKITSVLFPLHDTKDSFAGKEMEIHDRIAQPRAKPERTDMSFIVFKKEHSPAHHRIISGRFDNTQNGIHHSIAIHIPGFKPIDGIVHRPSIRTYPKLILGRCQTVKTKNIFLFSVYSQCPDQHAQGAHEAQAFQLSMFHSAKVHISFYPHKFWSI